MKNYTIQLSVVKTEEMLVARTSALICSEDGNEVFAVELDGSISGSVDEAIKICEKISEYTNENIITQATTGLLRAIKKLQEAE